MRILNYLLVAFAFLFCCAPAVSVKMLTDTQYNPNTSEKIDIFTNFNTIPYKFQQIAIIYSEDKEAMGYSENTLLTYATDKAKELGADGIVITGKETTNAGGVMIGNIFVAENSKSIQVVAIKKTNEPKECNKKCQFCGEEIKCEAIKCRFCGEWLNKD